MATSTAVRPHYQRRREKLSNLHLFTSPSLPNITPISKSLTQTSPAKKVERGMKLLKSLFPPAVQVNPRIDVNGRSDDLTGPAEVQNPERGRYDQLSTSNGASTLTLVSPEDESPRKKIGIEQDLDSFPKKKRFGKTIKPHKFHNLQISTNFTIPQNEQSPTSLPEPEVASALLPTHDYSMSKTVFTEQPVTKLYFNLPILPFGSHNSYNDVSDIRTLVVPLDPDSPALKRKAKLPPINNEVKLETIKEAERRSRALLGGNLSFQHYEQYRTPVRKFTKGKLRHISLQIRHRTFG